MTNSSPDDVWRLAIGISEALPEHSLPSVKRLDALPVELQINREAIQSRVFAIPGNADTCLGNELRQAAGGDLAELCRESELLEQLSRIARDSYPALLVDPEHRAWRYSDGHDSLIEVVSAFICVARNHPGFPQAVAAVANDGELSAACFDSNKQSPVLALHGSTVRVSVDTLTERLICQPVLRSIIERSRIPRPDEMCGVLTEYLADVRTMLSGKPVTTSVAVGLDGLALAEGVSSIETPWGKVVASERRVREIQPFGERATSVLLVPLNARAELVSDNDAKPLDPALTHDVPSDAAAKLAVAVLLGTGAAIRSVPGIAWCYDLTPLTDAESGWGRLRSPSMKPTLELGTEHAHEIARMSVLMETHLGDKLHVATGKLVSAVGDRLDPRDKLIDAVTAWENLVSRSPETAFSIAASLTILLEDDREKRDELSRSISSIYAMRSAIVHGRTKELATVYDHAAKAIEVGISAIRKLLLSRPELIDVEDSGKRARHLILDTKPRRVTGQSVNAPRDS